MASWFRSWKRALLPVALLLLTTLLTGGSHTPSAPPPEPLERFRFSSPHMGAMFQITLYAPDAARAEAAAEAAFQRIARLEDVMSDYMADSELMRLAAEPAGTVVPTSKDLFRVLQRAQEIAEATDGAFDVTAGPLTRLWRFSRKRNVLPSNTALAAASDALGWRHLQLDATQRTVTLLRPNMRLDLGGIGKGFAADAALAVLQQHGVSRALIAASGDVRAGDPPPGAEGWQVEVAGHEGRRVSLANAAISTSGDTEQFIEIDGVRYSHIVSPFTGLGLTHRIQATVIAPDAATSDALATACCVLGPERVLAVIEVWPEAAVLLTTFEGEQQVRRESARFPTPAR
jgi:FAD:protein FMN transferase